LKKKRVIFDLDGVLLKTWKAIVQATKVEEKVGDWYIVISSDKTIEDARKEAKKAIAKGGYKNIRIFKRRQYYVPIIGPYPTESEARQALVPIRERLRDTSFVVNFKKWNPDKEYSLQ